MMNDVVIKRTQESESTPPELEQAESSPPDESDPARDAYILTHSPQVLSALIIRRSGTGASQLVEDAIKAVGRLYDSIQRPDEELPDDGVAA